MSNAISYGPAGFDQDLNKSELGVRGPVLDELASLIQATPSARGPLGIADTPSGLSMGWVTSSNSMRSSATQARVLTPVEFADLFHNVNVSYFDGQSGMAHSVTVDVHIYNNNGLDDCRANMAEKAALVSGIVRELRRAGGLGLIDVGRDHKFQVAHCFFGKGNPDEFRVTLMHALRYGRATPANLQQYCDRRARLGVDCSGFVNTYFDGLSSQGAIDP